MAVSLPFLLRSCGATVGFLLLAGHCTAQPIYSVSDLGRSSDPPAPPVQYACCADKTLMNASGQLAFSRILSTGTWDSYFWEAGLSTPILIDSHSDDNVLVAAISSNGYVVGTSDGGVAVPYIWSKAAGRKPLFGQDGWYPFGVNSSGIVVGTQYSGGYHAVIWDTNNNTRFFVDDLQILGGGPWAIFQQARTISDDGKIAGIGRLTTPTGVETHYFLLTPISGGVGALSRSDWTVSATENALNDPPSSAIDGNINTRFSTGRGQHDNQGFAVSWPGDRTVGRIRMEVGPSTGDYPRTCGIWVADTSARVTFINCVADGSGNVDVSFTPLPVQKIEVWQWGVSGSWWSIAEFNAYPK